MRIIENGEHLDIQFTAVDRRKKDWEECKRFIMNYYKDNHIYHDDTYTWRIENTPKNIAIMKELQRHYLE